MTRWFFRTLAAACLPALAACAVGPDYQVPPPPAVTRYTETELPAQTASPGTSAGQPQRLVAGLDLQAEWWTMFHSEKLNGLVAEAIKNNPNVAAAQASLRAAREIVIAQRAAFFPSVTGGLSATHNQDSQVLAPTLASNALHYDLYAAHVGVSFTPDIFGLNSRAVESLDAQASIQRWQLEATYLTLVSNVVVAAITEASLRDQIADAEDIVRMETRVRDMTARAAALGQLSRVDVAAQDTALAQAQATLPPLRKQLAQARDQLTALLGRLPPDAPREQLVLDDLHLPADVPLSVPSSLVDRRPDVRAAEAALHAASAQIGVSIASALPQITLTATEGSAATQLAQWFGPGGGFWSVGGEVAGTLLDAGASWHKVSAARRTYEQMTALYRAAVVSAFQNVADSLGALTSDADALNTAVAAQHAAALTLSLVQQQQRLGQVSQLAALNAEQAYQQTTINVVQARASRLSDTVALYQALGGGWWNRPAQADAALLGEDRGR